MEQRRLPVCPPESGKILSHKLRFFSSPVEGRLLEEGSCASCRGQAGDGLALPQAELAPCEFVYSLFPGEPNGAGRLLAGAHGRSQGVSDLVRHPEGMYVCVCAPVLRAVYVLAYLYELTEFVCDSGCVHAVGEVRSCGQLDLRVSKPLEPPGKRQTPRGGGPGGGRLGRERTVDRRRGCHVSSSGRQRESPRERVGWGLSDQRAP